MTELGTLGINRIHVPIIIILLHCKCCASFIPFIDYSCNIVFCLLLGKCNIICLNICKKWQEMFQTFKKKTLVEYVLYVILKWEHYLPNLILSKSKVAPLKEKCNWQLQNKAHKLKPDNIYPHWTAHCKYCHTSIFWW